MIFSYYIIIEVNNKIILGIFIISIFLYKMWVNFIINFFFLEIEVWIEYTGVFCGG